MHLKLIMWYFLKNVYEGLKIASHAIWTNKLRAFLTTFGIVIGIVSVTTMATVIDGINRGFESSLDMLGKDVLYVQKRPWSFGPNYKWWNYINRREMKAGYADKIMEYSRYATAVAPLAQRDVSIKYEDNEAKNVQMTGTTTSYMKTSNANIDQGRFFTSEESHAGRQVCIIGADVASALFDYGSPLGKTIRVDGYDFEVIGLLEKQGKFLGLQSFDNQIIVPLNAYKKYFSIRRNLTLQVKYASDKSLNAGQYELEGIMRRIRQLDPLQKDDFAINKLDLFRAQYDAMTKVIYLIGIFLTALSLFVGGIGVMNIMFVSVKERTREIGIRKAIGARSSQILIQFLIEAIIICAFGGLIGVLLTGVIAHFINKVFVAYMDWTTVVVAFVITTLTGILFGYLPARKAASSDPIESLRYE